MIIIQIETIGGFSSPGSWVRAGWLCDRNVGVREPPSAGRCVRGSNFPSTVISRNDRILRKREKNRSMYAIKINYRYMNPLLPDTFGVKRLIMK